MKPESRFIGFEEVPFNRSEETITKVIGVITKGGHDLDGVLRTDVTIDGNDSTANIIKTIHESKFVTQLKGIFLKGLSLGGFNMIDCQKMAEALKIPVIIVMRDKPEKIRQTLTDLGLAETLLPLIDAAGEIHQFRGIFFQMIGGEPEQGREMLRLTCTNSHFPEPLRLSRMISRALE